MPTLARHCAAPSCSSSWRRRRTLSCSQQRRYRCLRVGASDTTALALPASRPISALQQNDISTSTDAEFAIPPRAPEASGTLLGAIALVAGTTVGAGILALPAKTFEAGFAPSAATLLLCWVYMSSTGLLLAEVNVNTLCALERKAVSLDSMAEETLGVVGARVSGATYIFIHYALLIAYMLQGGMLLLEYLASLPVDVAALPPAAGPPLFAALAGGAVFVGSEQQVELGNNILFGGVLAACERYVQDSNPRRWLRYSFAYPAGRLNPYGRTNPSSGSRGAARRRRPQPRPGAARPRRRAGGGAGGPRDGALPRLP